MSCQEGEHFEEMHWPVMSLFTPEWKRDMENHCKVYFGYVSLFVCNFYEKHFPHFLTNSYRAAMLYGSCL